MTTVLNLFGGPGVGKSTTATGVFSRLKQQDISCEYVSEYAKDLVWDGATELLNNQIHVFAEQFRRQWRLQNKVDYIITDSPILLSAIYFNIWFDKHKQEKTRFITETFAKKTTDYFLDTFNQFYNYNWYITRNKIYQEAGRVQTLEEAKKVDNSIWKFLHETDISFDVTDSQLSIDDIVEEVLFWEKEKKDAM